MIEEINVIYRERATYVMCDFCDADGNKLKSKISSTAQHEKKRTRLNLSQAIP